jgi:hypothetical protein
LDNSPQNLLDGRSLSDDEEENLGVLMALLGALLESEPICPGDGNLDKVVDFEDVEGLVENWGLPSVFDLNGDGITDQVDLEAQLERFGEACELPGENPGRLRIRQSADRILIQWPVSDSEWQLEKVSMLSGDTAWETLTADPVIIGANHTVVQSSDTSAFYRLRQ